MEENSFHSTSESVASPKFQKAHAFSLIAISFMVIPLMLILGDFVEEVSLNGFSEGAGNAFNKSFFDVLLAALFWGICILPINLIVLLLYRSFRWKKYRTVFVVGPSVGLFLFVMVMAIIEWPSPYRQFALDVGMPVPSSVRDFRSHFRHYSIGDIGDEFYFQCDATDTRKIIQILQLKEESLIPGTRQFYTKPDWPNPRDWTGIHVYSKQDAQTLSSFTLITDSTEGQVYLSIVE